MIEYVTTARNVVNRGSALVDFLENQLTGEVGFERGDRCLHQVDGAVSQTIARAIRDATQTANPALQQEAASWLWICCPDIAEQVELPELHYDTMPALAAAYLVGEGSM